MADIVDKPTRSRMMSGIKGKNTNPEMVVRKALFARGYRYRIHNRKLPGNPDIVLPKYNTAIQINGCFWHGHEDCHLFRIPKTRPEFWEKKISGNKERDNLKSEQLIQLGWRLITIWECALKGSSIDDFQDLVQKIEIFFQSPDCTVLDLRSHSTT